MFSNLNKCNVEVKLFINPFADGLEMDKLIEIIQKLKISGSIITQTDIIDSNFNEVDFNSINDRKVLENKFKAIGFNTIDENKFNIIFDRNAWG